MDVKQKHGELSRLIIRQEEKAQALLEFALSLMVLLLLTFGMIDFSRAAYTANVIQAAAQTGARAGLVDLNTVNQAVQKQLVGLDVQKAHMTTVVNNGRIEVQIAYEFKFITPFIALLAPQGHFTLQGSASMLIH